MNKSNLIDLNTFLFLKSLLDSKHLIFGFKIECLFAASKCLDENLVEKRKENKIMLLNTVRDLVLRKQTLNT
jgi:hypothetical protein